MPPDNAPPLISPGSHTRGRVPVTQIDEVVREHGVYQCVAEAGDVWLYATPILHASDSATAPARKVEAVPSARPHGGVESILVVEDHEDLRAFSAGVLRELGYRVLEAANGPSALEVLQAAQDVDLLFTDVVLPYGMDGRKLADEATRRRPGLKVLYTTGYTRNAIVHNGRLDPGVELIGKPFSFEGLAAKVRQVLDS